jgi:hypothetical protein
MSKKNAKGVLKSFPTIDGFVKSPSAVLRFIPALLNSRYARRRSRFNRVNHCGVPVVRLIPKDYSRSLRSAQSRHFVAGSQFRAPCIWRYLLCRIINEFLGDQQCFTLWLSWLLGIRAVIISFMLKES